jgi:fumarylacetoacetase
MTATLLDETHDPSARSWVESANAADTEFPLQNLPFGVFSRRGSNEPGCIGVAIGTSVLDLPACHAAGLFAGACVAEGGACRDVSLNALMALGPTHWRALRRRLSELLRAGHPDEGRHHAMVGPHLVPMAEVEMRVPAQVGDYTDFYASLDHATNVGRMMRPDNPLLPNYKWVPIGYHGRASSLVISGTPVCRPRGQMRPEGAETPIVGPSRRLDYEVEVGAFVGPGNRLGHPIPLADADRHVFGLCLVNDWSARDVQAWEYQPLGPFLAKNFATSVSPWVVTIDALAPFRVPPVARPEGDPAPLAYLDGEDHQAWGATDIQVEVHLSTARMRAAGTEAARLSRARFRDMYWTIPQLIAHHTMGGCNLRPGDLLASGTVSGPEPSMRGCLLELSWRGQHPVDLPGGERRAFLEDGDEVVLRAWCEREGATRIGFGECRGRVVAEP